ncbi:MAG: hypothetical protein M3416_15145 [Acidobacteriota bacterium]|nr:hypothetical protein [Acidobacteriota bacterium]
MKTSALSALAVGCALGPGLRAFGQDSDQSDPDADFPIPYEATQDPVFYYTRETFEPYVGGVFRGWVGRTPVDLVLLSVTSYAPASTTKIMTVRARKVETFSLTFHAARSLSLLTDVHKLEHAALGRFALGMKRSVDERGRIFYEAVISHIV